MQSVTPLPRLDAGRQLADPSQRTGVMSGDATGDATGGVSGDGRWMTYTELARVRGISKSSAERLVFRNHWRRQRGNNGVTRALVPLDSLTGVRRPIRAKLHGSVLHAISRGTPVAVVPRCRGRNQWPLLVLDAM